MRQGWPICVAVMALACLTGLAAGQEPSGVSLSVTSFPPTFDVPQEDLPPPTKIAPPSWKELVDQQAHEVSGVCSPDTEDDQGRGPLLNLLRRIRDRAKWQPIGQHPRMFGEVVPQAADEKNAKPKGPTTFPQALWRYLQCVRSHGANLKGEAKTNGDGKKGENGEQKDGKKKENGEEKGGKSSPLDPGQISAQDPGAARQEPGAVSLQPAPQPLDQLGAERGGRTINIGGETGLTPTGYVPTWYSAHAQGTVVDSVHDHFFAAYSGPNSLLRVEPHATSETTTLFFAARLWEGGEFVFNPEVAGGRGFSGTDGIAGFPNGEITRVGLVEPTPYLARLYLRQTIGFGGEEEKLEDGVNQIAGTRDVNHLIIAVGRFSATDVADDNRFSHDPRTQFLAWSLMYNGAWDYPANVRGYTDGIALDYNQKHWAIHYAIMAEPRVANGSALDPNFLKANGQVLEWVGRYKLGERPGNLRLMTYLNRAHMGDYAEALALMPVNPNVTATRDYRYKYGFGLSWDQEVTKDVGIFSRLGWSDGHTETWAFTPIDRLVEFGVWIGGRSWCRPNDQFGIAFDINGLARDHRDYLAAGGLDFSIGDGALSYGHEMVLESLYNLGVTKNILLSLDFQEVWNPAYNRARGPVTIFQGRFHIEF